MLKIVTYNRLVLIIIHLIIGLLGSVFPIILKPFFLLVIAYAIYDIFKNRNSNEEAFLWSSYIVGAEVFLRMIKATVFYETGKYAVLVFLFLGILINNKKILFSFSYYTYIFLLLIGVFFTEIPYGESIRKAIAFNLSGPIVLGVSALYFYKRKIQINQLFNGFYLMLLPLFSMVIYLYIKTPSIREILFGGSANFTTSGGFGPNQVATAIGLGIFILTVFLVLKVKLTGYVIVDALFLCYFIYRGLLTFSRGGMITGLVAVFSFLFFYVLYKKKSFKLFSKYLLLGSVFLLSIWLYTSNVTGGMLVNRYAGKNAKGIQKQDVSSGRTKIFKMQLESFYDSPIFGIGVGSGKYKRIYSGEEVVAASHNEVSRLIEEHGSIGIVILLILLVQPLLYIFKSNNFQRAFLSAFLLFWFLTICHSAMRIAFPSFIYALSLINIVDQEDG